MILGLKMKPQDFLARLPNQLVKHGEVWCENQTHIIQISRTNTKEEIGGYCHLCNLALIWTPSDV